MSDTVVTIKLDESSVHYQRTGDLGVYIIWWVLRDGGDEAKTYSSMGSVLANTIEQVQSAIAERQNKLEEEGTQVLYVSWKLLDTIFESLSSDIRAYQVIAQFSENVDKGKADK